MILILFFNFSSSFSVTIASFFLSYRVKEISDMNRTVKETMIALDIISVRLLRR